MQTQQPNKLRVFVALVSLIFLLPTATSAQIVEIPISPPGPDKWIVDLTGQVPGQAITELNQLCTELFEVNNRELAVVVIDSTNGRDHRSFGTQLFNQWGVGSGVKNNGVLILFALEDRAAEIILGQGEDYDHQVRKAEKIMDDIIVANMKKGDLGNAIYEGTRACATRILGIAHTESPRNLDEAADQEGIPRQRVRRPRRSLIQRISDAGPVPWFVGLGICGFGGIIWFRHFNRYRARNCLVCGSDTVLLTEEQDDDFLDPPELLEEQLGSVDYDVWACLHCEEVVKIRYGKWFTRYSDCPRCDYKTLLKISRTLVAATENRGGRVRVDEDCRNCTYHRSYTYRTPKIPKSKSSGSSGFSSSGSSSSSGGFRSYSGGGRFGGGRSAGRGASGRW